MYYVITKNNVFDGVILGDVYTLNLPAEYSISKLDEALPDLGKYTWNADTGTWIHRGSIYSKLEFLAKFTTQECVNIWGSVDPYVNDFTRLLMVADYIDTSDPATIAGINYLATTNLITSERAAEILIVWQ